MHHPHAQANETRGSPMLPVRAYRPLTTTFHGRSPFTRHTAQPLWSFATAHRAGYKPATIARHPRHSTRFPNSQKSFLLKQTCFFFVVVLFQPRPRRVTVSATILLRQTFLQLRPTSLPVNRHPDARSSDASQKAKRPAYLSISVFSTPSLRLCIPRRVSQGTRPLTWFKMFVIRTRARCSIWYG